jgi:hypothetical protein
MTEEKKKINPSKRIQGEEDSILFQIENEKKYFQKAYIDQKVISYRWKDREWEMEKKRNEWRLFSMMLGILAIVLIILLVI